MAVDMPEEYGGLAMDKVTSAIVAEQHRHAGQLRHYIQRACGNRHAADRLVRHARAEAEVSSKAGVREWVGAYALSEVVLRLRRDEHAGPRGAVAGRQALHPERRENVDHQCGLRGPVHRVRQGRRREVLRVSGRGDTPGFDRRRGGAQARHPRLVHLPADPHRLQGSRREPARRNRQGPPHRLQHPQHRPLQAGRSCVGGAKHSLRKRHSLCEGAQGLRQDHHRIRPDPAEDLAECADRHLRRREHGLPHRRHDRCGACGARCDARTTRSRDPEDASRNTPSSARS